MKNMRPMSAYPNLETKERSIKVESFASDQVRRPNSSYSSRNRVLKSSSSAYQTWLRRSNEFNYDIRKHPRDYNSVQTFNLRSGCQLSKSRSQLQVKIDPDEFFDPKLPTPVEAKIPVKEMEILIQNLQEQVKYLTLYLEEERLHHGGTKKRAKMDVEKAKREMEILKDEEIGRIVQNHLEFVEELKREQSQQMEELEDDLKRQYQKLEKEYKILQASFKNYRNKITEEMEVKWNARKKEFDWEKQRAVDNAVANNRRVMEERFNKERISIRTEYKELMQQMVADQRKEMEDFMRKMSDGKSSIEDLKARAEDADRLEKELQETKEKLEATKRDIKKLTHEFNETQAQLMIYENKFEEKVGAVEDKYRKRIDDLVNEVADFRIMLIRKAEMLYMERANADELQKRWTQFAKEKLEERLFGNNNNTTKPRTISPTVNNRGVQDKDAESDHKCRRAVSDAMGAGDAKLEQHPTKGTNNLTNGMNVPMSVLRKNDSGKIFSLPPKKRPTSKKDTASETEKDIGITKAGKDKIRPRLPITTISLLETADLPYVENENVSPRSTSPRPQSPDVIY